MNELEKPLRVHKRGEISAQITERVRKLILKGELAVGEKLPALRTLAKHWGTNYVTVYSALSPLVEEGLLQGRTGSGIVVSGQRVRLRLRRMAIYTSQDFHQQKDMQFYDCLYRCLCTGLAGQDVEPVLFIDPRAKGHDGYPLPPLQSAVESGDIQGLIVLTGNAANDPWLRRLKVAKAFSGNRIKLDFEDLIQLSLARLAADGCQTVGLITSIALKSDWAPVFHRPFRKWAKTLKLRTDDTWIKAAQTFPRSLETFGYRAFTALWEEKSRPDGILVYPDNVAMGAVAAILEKRVKIPSQLKVVLHRQAELHYFCPLSVIWVENTIACMAGELIRAIQSQLEGDEFCPSPGQFSILENDTPPA